MDSGSGDGLAICGECNCSSTYIPLHHGNIYYVSHLNGRYIIAGVEIVTGE